MLTSDTAASTEVEDPGSSFRATFACFVEVDAVNGSDATKRHPVMRTRGADPDLPVEIWASDTPLDQLWGSAPKGMLFGLRISKHGDYAVLVNRHPGRLSLNDNVVEHEGRLLEGVNRVRILGQNGESDNPFILIYVATYHPL